MSRRRYALACLLAAACGSRSSSQPPPTPRDAEISHDAAAAQVDVAALPLGLPDLAAFQWRKRAGQPAFRNARKAEAAGDWPAVVATCRQALAADPGHLDAAWLLAVGLAKLGKHDELVAPLQRSVAGDFGKWGHASLEQPALQPFLATPLGEAWKRRLDEDQPAFLAALARAVVVTAGGDLYAYDPEAPRWYRLTRTLGAVIGGLRVPAANKIIYVTRQRAKSRTTLAVGIIDLARGRAIRPIELGTPGPVEIAYATTRRPGVWIGSGAPRRTWRHLDDDGRLTALPPKSTRPAGPWLAADGQAVVPHAIPVPDVTADFDDHGLASAFRIGKSHRVVSVPSPGVVDGHTAAWSADRAHLAFVAVLDDRCVPGATDTAAFVVDAATGALQELERGAAGLAVEWVAERKLAIAGDRGVAIHDLDGAPPFVIGDADGLVTPRKRPACAPGEGSAPGAPGEPPPAADDPDGSDTAVVQPTDAGVVGPP